MTTTKYPLTIRVYLKQPEDLVDKKASENNIQYNWEPECSP
jgi:hypothetical protein